MHHAHYSVWKFKPLAAVLRPLFWLSPAPAQTVQGAAAATELETIVVEAEYERDRPGHGKVCDKYVRRLPGRG